MDSSLDAISAFLLKHPLGDFARGEIAFAPAIAVLPLVLVIAAAIAVTWFTVHRLRRTATRDRVILGLIRTAVFALLGFCLLRPTLVLSHAIAQRNVLAVVLDDSRSMMVTDTDAGTRLAAVQQSFADSSDLVRRLGDRFALRFFRAGSDAVPDRGAAALQGTATRTDLAAALGGVRETLADLPLAGIVLVSDGARNGSGDLDAELLRLGAREIPVHTVGVGTARFTRDIGIDALRLPREVLVGGQAAGEAVLTLRAVGRRRAVVSTLADGRLVGRDTVRLPDGIEQLVVPVRVPVFEPGVVAVQVSVDPLDGEVTTLNNQARAVLRVRGGPEKILYVEGEPRPELPFLRRAAATDSALQLVTLVRTGRQKHLRLGVDDSLELVHGFPTERAELFRYRAIVLGSIEASYFTADQLRMLQEFAGVRGGGLLALGGRRALAEGGYAATPVDEALPMVLDIAANGQDARAATTITVSATAAGAEHPALGSLGAGVSAWSDLPTLTIVNAAGRLRPGATVLLEGRSTAATLPVLAVQRYGRGHTALFLPQDAWRWQLTDRLPEGDRSLVAFWTRLLRWTVTDVPDPLQFDAEPGITAPGEMVQLRVRVGDSTFTPRDDAQVSVQVVPPDAPAYQVALEADLGTSGEYHGRFTPTSAGRYRLDVSARMAGDTLHATGLVVSDTDRGDPGSMERDDAVLARIAEQTGGRNYDLSRVASLPDDVLLTRSGITARITSDLWDAPLVFLVMVILLGCDWAWRRHRGLA